MGFRGRGSERPGLKEGALGVSGCSGTDAAAWEDTVGPGSCLASAANRGARASPRSAARCRRPPCAPLCAPRSRRAPGVSKSGQLMGCALIGCSVVSSSPARPPSRPPPTSPSCPAASCPPRPLGAARRRDTICNPSNKRAAQPRNPGSARPLRLYRCCREQRAAPSFFFFF